MDLASLALALIALIGVPPTSIFIAKIYVFTAAVNSGLAWLAILGVVNSVVSAYYYLRVVRVMYLLPPLSEEPVRAGPSMGLAVACTFAGTAIFGLYPTPLLNLAKTAAEVLLAGFQV